MYSKSTLSVIACLLLLGNAFGLEANEVQTPSHTSGIPIIATNFPTPCAITHPVCPDSFQPCPQDCPDACYVNSTNPCCPMQGPVYCPNQTYPPSSGATTTEQASSTSTTSATANNTSSSLPSSSIVSTNGSTSVSTSAPSQSESNSSTTTQPSGTNASAAAISGRTSLGALAVVVFGALMLL